MTRLSFGESPDQAIAKYAEDGYFIEPGVILSEDCDRFIEAAHRLPAPASGDYRPIVQVHRQDPVFLQALRRASLVSIVERIVGAPAVGLQTEFFFHGRQVTGFTNHQDNLYVNAPEEHFVSAWIALTDVGPENGGLSGYPGSHKFGRLPVNQLDISGIDTTGQDPNALNKECVMPPGLSRVSIRLSKGSIVFIHGHFVHSSSLNQTDGFRYALLCTYVKQGVPFEAGRHARREPISLSLEKSPAS